MLKNLEEIIRNLFPYVIKKLSNKEIISLHTSNAVIEEGDAEQRIAEVTACLSSSAQCLVRYMASPGHDA